MWFLEITRRWIGAWGSMSLMMKQCSLSNSFSVGISFLLNWQKRHSEFFKIDPFDNPFSGIRSTHYTGLFSNELVL